MSHRPSPLRRPPRRSRQSGVLLGVVLILLVVLFAAGLFALWSMRGDTASAGQDRLSRQLFDCAEQGLAWGKQNVSVNIAQNSALLNSYLAANICNTSTSSLSTIGPLPCWDKNGPFPNVCTGAVPAGYPWTTQITMDTRRTAAGQGPDFEYTVAIYNDPADANTCSDDGKNRVIVYSRCTDLSTLQQRSVSALISVTSATPNDYTGQAGRGFRNQGNQNF